MRIDNVHERVVTGGPDEIGPLLATLGQPDDALYPPSWPPMRFADGIAVGSRGTHGVISAYEPGRLLEFSFPPGMGITGTHTFTVTPLGDGRSRVRHVVDADAVPAAWLAWKAAIQPAHDAVLEELLDRLASATGAPPARPAVPSVHARLLRRFQRPRAEATDVRLDGLAAGALPRVDFADAFAVERRRETPGDPQVWADAIFHSPPAWVAALMGLREALVGLVGIERGTPDAFAVLAQDGGRAPAGQRLRAPRLPGRGAHRARAGRAHHRGAAEQPARSGLLRAGPARASARGAVDDAPGRRAAVAKVQSARRRREHAGRMTAAIDTTVTGRFDITAWDEESYSDENGVRLVTVANAKTFEGGISGTSTARLLQAFAQHGSVAYVGIELVVGAVGGRSGTFVLQHSAVGSAAGGSMTVAVVPDSGTGELTGLSGDMQIAKSADGEHTYTFAYRI